MASCGAYFTVADAYDSGNYRCTLDVHDGPHVDDINNYTWGRIEGPDGYTRERRQKLEALAQRRRSSFAEWTRKRFLNAPER